MLDRHFGCQYWSQVIEKIHVNMKVIILCRNLKFTHIGTYWHIGTHLPQPFFDDRGNSELYRDSPWIPCRIHNHNSVSPRQSEPKATNLWCQQKKGYLVIILKFLDTKLTFELKLPLQAWLLFSAVDFQRALLHPNYLTLINSDPRVGQTWKPLTRHRCTKIWHICKSRFITLESEGTEGECGPNMCRINKRVLHFS
jgi:hypothetical protein